MLPSEAVTRVDLLELKALIIRKIGHQRANKYFEHLKRFFSLKITKSEFDKFCIRIVGRENIPLHNRFIRSIVKNACLAKVPPQTVAKKGESNLTVKTGKGHQRNRLQSLYGDAFPSSPRKGRSPINRDRKFRGSSPLGPVGEPQSIVYNERNSMVQEQQSATELLSLGSRPPVEVASVEEGEEVEQTAAGSPGIQSRSPVTAPFGISMNLGGARKALSNVSMRGNQIQETCLNSCELPDTRSLRNRLEQKLEAEGITVSVDYMNLLNNGLDVYLKRLIEPCIGLASSRSGKQHSKTANNQLDPGLNGMARDIQMQRLPESVNASRLDFLVAMQSNPQILGENWATKLERISILAFEEQ